MAPTVALKSAEALTKLKARDTWIDFSVDFAEQPFHVCLLPMRFVRASADLMPTFFAMC